jgi:uncharacterized protein YjiS (DUF1127 family)
MTILKKISRFLEKRAQYRHAIGQLSNMSDRELSDIGVNRADIHDIVRQDMIRKSSH